MKILNKLFEDMEIIIIEEDNVLLFEVESVAMAIGYVTVAKGKEYPHKSRIEKTLKNAEISAVVHGVQRFMNESQLYDFLIELILQKQKHLKNGCQKKFYLLSREQVLISKMGEKRKWSKDTFRQLVMK